MYKGSIFSLNIIVIK